MAEIGGKGSNTISQVSRVRSVVYFHPYQIFQLPCTSLHLVGIWGRKATSMQWETRITRIIPVGMNSVMNMASMWWTRPTLKHTALWRIWPFLCWLVTGPETRNLPNTPNTQPFDPTLDREFGLGLERSVPPPCAEHVSTCQEPSLRHRLVVGQRERLGSQLRCLRRGLTALGSPTTTSAIWRSGIPRRCRVLLWWWARPAVCELMNDSCVREGLGMFQDVSELMFLTG